MARRTPWEEGIRIHPQGILGPCFIPPKCQVSDHLCVAQGHGQRVVSPFLLSPAPRPVPGSWSLQMNRSPSWNKRCDRSHRFFLEKHKQAKGDVGQIGGNIGVQSATRMTQNTWYEYKEPEANLFYCCVGVWWAARGWYPQNSPTAGLSGP